MAYQSNFVEILDALVRLCAARPDAFQEQQLLLSAAARAISAGEVTIMAGPDWPTLNGAHLDGLATTPGGLVDRLWNRGFQRLFVARDAEPADLLMLARSLAGVSTGEAEGIELRLRTVRIAPVAVDTSRVELRALVDSSSSSPSPDQCPFEPSTREPTGTADMLAVPLETVVGDDGVPAGELRIAPMINTPVLLRTIIAHDKRDLPLIELLALLSEVDGLPEWQRVPELSLILEEVGRRAEAALRQGDAALLLSVVLPVFRGSDSELHAEAQLAYRQTRRRLLAKPYLRLVAPMLPRMPDSREEIVYLLGQAGEDGADAVIEQLIESRSPSDRRAYISTLVRLGAGAQTLLHMLTDERWYIVRNAADLLGEMQVKGAEQPLGDALSHADERVRRSALAALVRLGTPAALLSVQGALASPHATLRIEAASELAASNWPYTVTAVRRRLRDEDEPEVQLALVAALGRIASNEAIGVLAELTEPAMILQRRATPLRTAALRSLVEAHTPAAREVVERLSGNWSSELRGEARQAIRNWSRA